MSYKIFLILILVINVILRVHFAGQIEFPLTPKNNPVHLNTADKLYEGKGFTQDYLYFYTPNMTPEITHPSNGIFMPFTSLIIYLSYLIFGKSLFHISFFSIAASIFISIFIYLFIKELTESKTTRFSAFLFSLFLPTFFLDSILPISEIYSTLFIIWALYWIMLGLKRNPVFLILSGIPAAAATLTSLVGFAIFPIMIILGLQYKKLKIWRSIVFFFIVSFLIFIPWLLRNNMTFGSIFILRLDKLLFLKSFEDLFSYSKEISASTFFDWGFLNIITFKIKSILSFLVNMINFSSIIISFLGLTGIIISFIEQRMKKELAGYFFFFITILFFVGFLFPAAAENEILRNSICSFIPFLVIFAALGIERIITNKMYRKIIVVIAFMLLVYTSIIETRIYIKDSALHFAKYEKIKNQLEIYRPENPKIITATPAEVNLITGYKTLMLPSEGDSTIIKAAEKFGANFLLSSKDAKYNIPPDELNDLQLLYIDYNSDFRLYKFLPDEMNDKNFPRK